MWPGACDKRYVHQNISNERDEKCFRKEIKLKVSRGAHILQFSIGRLQRK